MSSFGVILFATTSAAFRAEKVLAEAGLRIKLIPTPRHLSSDCGIALRFDWAGRCRVQQLLDSSGVETQGVHLLDEEGA